MGERLWELSPHSVNTPEEFQNNKKFILAAIEQNLDIVKQISDEKKRELEI